MKKWSSGWLFSFSYGSSMKMSSLAAVNKVFLSSTTLYFITNNLNSIKSVLPEPAF